MFLCACVLFSTINFTHPFFSSRQRNPKKYSALEKKLRAPLQENVQEQFQVLRTLQKRMSNDTEQSAILLNYLEDKYSTDGSRKKRVKLTTF